MIQDLEQNLREISEPTFQPALLICICSMHFARYSQTSRPFGTGSSIMTRYIQVRAPEQNTKRDTTWRCSRSDQTPVRGDHAR
jgi:hypothetical protein